MMALDRISEDDDAACPPSRFARASSSSASKKKSSRGKSGGGGSGGPTTVTPDLYRSALNRKWSAVISRATTHPEEARYVNPSDGLTALHLAVMSRVVPTTQSFGPKASKSTESGRLRNSHGAEIPGLTGRIKSPAPMDAVRSLLVAWPDGALVRDRRRGYTPLAYACLVAPPPREDEEGGGDDCTVYSAYSAYSTKSKTTVYAALQRDSYGILEEAEKLVRLLLRHRPECTSQLTHDGLSPLDVHIVSYSVGWGAEESENGAAGGGGGAGRTSSGVLRTLLESDPSLARSRPRREGGVETVGPLELLYKYNAGGFLGTLAQEEEKVKVARTGGAGTIAAAVGAAASRKKKADSDAASVAAGGEVSARQGLNSARNALSSWWVWKWSILLLKYLHHKRGRKFQAVHAAASVPGCPLPLLMLAVRAFPNQIREGDEYENDGSLPLHMVAGWGRLPDSVARRVALGSDEERSDEEEEELDPRALAAAAAAADPITSSRRGMVLSELLTEYPQAAHMRNVEGKTPLALALESGSVWQGGGAVRRLVRAWPPALMVRDEITFLMPFMTAACYRVPEPLKGLGGSGIASATGRRSQKAGDDRRLTTTVYELLRAQPMALLRFVPGRTEEDVEFGQWGTGGGRRRKKGRREAANAPRRNYARKPPQTG